MTAAHPAKDVVDASQAALAAEHQAVYGYSLLGPHLSGADQTLAVACSNAHEDIRNVTESAIAATGITPVQSRADYPSLYPVPSAAAARRLAVRLEDDCAAAWRHLFAVAAPRAEASGAVVRSAQEQLTACAVRATRWRVATGSSAPTVPFPGIG